MLRIYGYYDALVFRSVGGIEPGEEDAAKGADAGQPTVRFEIVPGAQYRFGAIDLGDLAAAAVRLPMLARELPDRQRDDLLSTRSSRALRSRPRRSARTAIRSRRSRADCSSIH
jgi:translocation and assembly module TamA